MEFPSFDYEASLIDMGYHYIVGVDEAGRGSGIGSVVAGAVRIPPEFVPFFYGKVNDSKKLSPKKREELYDLILEKCDVGIGSINNNIIDEINILEATKMAMMRAVNALPQPDFVLIDGTVVLDGSIGCSQMSLVKGDSLSLSIAAGSIIAKVTRDRSVVDLHKKYPIYSWNKNKGYLTKEHIEAIRAYGPCEYHRMSFKKVGK